MRLLFVFMFIMWCTCALFGQDKNKDNPDIVPFSPDIEAVEDTLEEIHIFENEAPMNLVLKYDITSFIRKKMKGDYLDAELEISYRGFTSKKQIRLKARGNNRRETCFFPPIYLNFKTDPIQQTELKGFRKVKMVTHCASAKVYTEYILREFLVYKLYNVLTENSFRVKLLNIEYIDTGKKGRNYEKYGFLLEPIELLAERTDAIEVNGAVVQSHNVVEYDTDVLALFQYAIGNTDWRIKGGHNTKFLKSITSISPKVTPVPYDFDFAGFVGTAYAVPQSWTSVENVREREYMGYCRDNDAEYIKAIDLMVEKKEELFETIDAFQYLDKKEKKRLAHYLKEFYALAEHPKALVNMLNRECRGKDF